MGTQSLFPPSSEQELLALRRRCASSLWSLVPKGVGRLYFGSIARRAHPDGSAAGAAGPPDQNPPQGLTTPPPPLPRTGPSRGDSSPLDRDYGATRSGQQQQQSRESQQRRQQQQQQQQQQRNQSSPSLATDARGDAADHLSASGGVGVVAGGPGDPGRAAVDRTGPSPDPGLDADDERIVSEIESGILDVFGDAYCNKHLMYGVLELLLVRLMPELAERGVVDLWAERLV